MKTHIVLRTRSKNVCTKQLITRPEKQEEPHQLPCHARQLHGSAGKRELGHGPAAADCRVQPRQCTDAGQEWDRYKYQLKQYELQHAASAHKLAEHGVLG